MRALVAGLVGCAGAPSGTDAEPAPLESGHPGIQIGQTGTAYDCVVEQLEDPSVPAGGFVASATAWWDALPRALPGVFGPVDRGIADLDGVPLVVTLTGSGVFGITEGDCGVNYVAEAVVALDAGGVLTAAFDGWITAEGPDAASWSSTVPAEAVGGALGDPDLGDLAPFPRVLWSSGAFDAEHGSGQLTWIVDDGDPDYVWWVPVASWSAGAR